MKRITIIVILGLSVVSYGDINEKLARLDLTRASLSDVVEVLGEPIRYTSNGKTISKDNLPAGYLAEYPDEFQIWFAGNQVKELRFEGPGSGYLFEGRLKIGSSLETALDVMGQPDKTVPIAFPGNNPMLDGVLYKFMRKGKALGGYYARKNRGLRLFFQDNKIVTLYVTGFHSDSQTDGQRQQTFRPEEHHQDVRYRDLTDLDLSRQKQRLLTWRFNEKTAWPTPDKLPPDFSPQTIMHNAKNPGLGIHQLHEQGITGKGVHVAIIDQPMYLGHPEFKGKVASYRDMGCGSESSMHGPAMTSLLVGHQCGTAPDAHVTFVAVPSWLLDAAYYARALDWIISHNRTLVPDRKIRVVSVSAAPSGPGTLFVHNPHHQSLWDQAVARAKEDGILVLDCTKHQGFIAGCRLDHQDPGKLHTCVPFTHKEHFDTHLFVPMAPRTVAQEFEKGKYTYQYCGDGGLSCAIPYAAGVLALGWQVRPEIAGEQMKDLLFESAYQHETGAKIIHPAGFIERVRASMGESK